MTDLVTWLNPFQSGWGRLFWAIVFISPPGQRIMAQIYDGIKGFRGDRLVTQPTSASNILYRVPDLGICEYVQEIPTGETESVGNEEDRKIVLTLKDPRGKEHEIPTWKLRGIHPNQAMRNGEDEGAYYELTKTEDIHTENYRRMRDRLLAREEEMAEMRKGTHKAIDVWSRSLSEAQKRFRSPMIPLKRGSTQLVSQDVGDVE